MFDVNKINDEIRRNQKDFDILKNNEQQGTKDSVKLERDLRDTEKDVRRAEEELKKVTDKRDKIKQEKERVDQSLSIYRSKKADYEKNIQTLKAELERNIAQLQADARKK